MAVSKSTYQKIYALLDRVSPVPYDCGKLCTAACCGCAGLPEGKDEEELGMFLLPGEEQMLLHNRLVAVLIGKLLTILHCLQ